MSVLPKCRFCHAPLTHTFVDLGISPLSNSYVKKSDLNKGEIFYPLNVKVCSSCKLVQLEEFEKPESIFNSEYAYFSSYSSTWLEHARVYCDEMLNRFRLTEKSQVVEIASNDGYLLKNFVALGIPALGIEPTKNTAEAAMAQGVNTLVSFFGKSTADDLVLSGFSADLLVANNVLAHVPDINDFVSGLKLLLKPEGVITVEFPHLLNLIKYNQFDTIYHEHFSYFSLLVVDKIFSFYGLEIFDVEELPTHGGSLRVFAQHVNGKHAVKSSVGFVIDKELCAGFDSLEVYDSFSDRVNKIKYDLLNFLLLAKSKGLKVAGYGAPAKGNTLLNYCGVHSDLIQFTVDSNPHKQGTYLPGTRIPVYEPSELRNMKPDIVIILPWNIKEEIISLHGYISEWGGRFAVSIPSVGFVD